MIEKWFIRLWYSQPNGLSRILLPFSWLYRIANSGKQWFGRVFQRRASPCPVLVVGNISVGGVGKTPLVIALVQFCQQQGIRVGVVSRGYGSRCSVYPKEVLATDLASEVGDEPLLIVKKTGVPVFIAPDRPQAVQQCYDKYRCDLIISDDGLQHQAMARDIEIIVVDGERGLGNGMCLPAGPLRDPPRRLQQADLLVCHHGNWPDAFLMELKVTGLFHLPTHQPLYWHQLSGPVTAVAGIGNPQRFFRLLASFGLTVNPTGFADHEAYTQKQYLSLHKPVVMTEKDAVKCYQYATGEDYFVAVAAHLPGRFWQQLAKLMHEKGIL